MDEQDWSSQKAWMKVVPEEERALYRQSGFGERQPFGNVPVLIVIDVTLAFTGSKHQPVADAIREYPTACGEVAWESLPRIARLLKLFRDRSWPVVFTRNDSLDQAFAGGATKRVRSKPSPPSGQEFPAEIAPLESEWVLEKAKASCFFATPLSSYLQLQKVDTLVVCGVSTSGCVRASVVDACSHGYTTYLIDDCCFDRSHFAHCANLFDISAKYASVVSLAELETVCLSINLSDNGDSI
ncbi:MAG: isochorismatase family protein [Marinobacter sp.]|uniref:isochorismatase family protein n=1 Tax=Marinobacter sp. TaxID=50741 RepID=UPI00349FEB71